MKEFLKSWWKSILAWIVAIPLAFGGGFGVGVKQVPEKMVEKVVERVIPLTDAPKPNAITDKKEAVKPKSSDWCRQVKSWYDYYKPILTEEQMLAYAKSYGWRAIDVERAKACIK